MGRRAPALLGLAAAVIASPALAQDDGPRVYQLVPEGARNVTAFLVNKRGDHAPDPATGQPGSEIDTDILVLRYVTSLNVGGRSFAPFVIVPMGQVNATGAPKSSGFGDAQIGAGLGLVGAPALKPDAFAAFKPGFGLQVLGRVFLPTGEYSADKPVNFGSNRVSYQIGLPMVYAWGSSYRDPRLTSLEVLPTLNFYEANSDPFGADESRKETQVGLEAHLTHNLSRRVWVSADLLARLGGETSTDGRANGDHTRGWSAGGSVAFPLAGATIALTYQHAVERKDDGPDGWFFRTALIAPF
ncbi:MAG: transporter [Caulobacter sp.]|nr:transporter [Caulobacter sp.]